MHRPSTRWLSLALALLLAVCAPLAAGAQARAVAQGFATGTASSTGDTLQDHRQATPVEAPLLSWSAGVLDAEPSEGVGRVVRSAFAVAYASSAAISFTGRPGAASAVPLRILLCTYRL